MNQESQYVFNIYHFLLNLRDTMEFTMNRDHPIASYEQRKTVITKGIEQGSAFGNFLENNKEQSAKLVEKLHEFIDDIYGDDSTILHPAGELVRVDHSQNIKILEETIQLSESVRDVLYGYVRFTKQQNKLDKEVEDVINRDEKLYRCVVEMLVISEFEKSFGNFQQLMGESKGQPTPQSNFVVQNELAKLSNLLRFSRQHAHCTDNETLDILDHALQVIEMSEGRRDRRGNKSFKELFDEVNKEISEAVHVRELLWKETFDKALQIVIREQQDAKAQADSVKITDGKAEA